MAMLFPPPGYNEARRRAAKAACRGDLKTMRAWLAATEQLLRVERLGEEYDRAQEKHDAWRRDRPHRQK